MSEPDGPPTGSPSPVERQRIVSLGAREVDRVEPLWRGMVEYHRAVAGAEWPVREGGEAWRLRRAQYVDWLEEGSGWLLASVPAEARERPPIGYAMVCVHPPGATWDLGERVGELESLAVAADARGSGVGSRLLAAARQRLLDEGIGYWSVGVVEANEGATRLYQRAGFRPYYRLLLAPLGGPAG